jgi:hypothetical protein
MADAGKGSSTFNTPVQSEMRESNLAQVSCALPLTRFQTCCQPGGSDSYSLIEIAERAGILAASANS